MTWKIITDDCRAMLGGVDGSSVDAVVTDPPYEIGFMGKKWDSSGIAYNPAVWGEVLRVLKPGGHLLAFGGTRTSHRLVCAIEDVGFEIRDSIHWIYGSGFPKSRDVSKAIDREVGVERKVVGRKIVVGTNQPMSNKQAAGGRRGDSSKGWDRPWRSDPDRLEANCSITAPATEAAKQWEGWGTALKPAHEPIVVARKPLTGTVAQNVLKHGTGALNIDECLVESVGGEHRVGESSQENRYTDKGSTNFAATPGPRGGAPEGRWPPNICLSPEAAAELDRQSGELSNCGGPKKTTHDSGMFGIGQPGVVYPDSGGASRFFPIFRYQPKASRREREAGLEPIGADPSFPQGTHPRRVSEEQGNRNPHPTVKPVALMQWLCRLVTPPGGTVLDPFLGSGTTGIAAIREGFNFIGIELNPGDVEIATRRIEEDAPLFNRKVAGT